MNRPSTYPVPLITVLHLTYPTTPNHLAIELLALILVSSTQLQCYCSSLANLNHTSAHDNISAFSSTSYLQAYSLAGAHGYTRYLKAVGITTDDPVQSLSTYFHQHNSQADISLTVSHTQQQK